MTERRPTLVVHAGGIGDFLLACPAIALLGRTARVELLGRRARLQLGVAGGIAQVAHDMDRVDFQSLLTRPSTKLREFLGRFSRVVIWMKDEDGTIWQNLAKSRFESAEVHAGLPPDQWDRHATAYYLGCLGLPDPPALRLDIPAGDTAHDVIIHPGSGSPAKNWPFGRFLELAALLESRGREVAWCLGPAEVERDDGRLGAIRDAKRIEEDSLCRLAAHLAAARLYVGNDSGVTHLAAAVGCPTVALFGPTKAAVWAPRGIHVRVLEDFDRVTPRHVLESADSIGLRSAAPA